MFVVLKVKFGDVVKEVKNKIDRNNNPYEYYVAGDHMDSEDLTIHRRGCFATDDVGPAFIREFRKGQVLYGSRRTYLKKVAVADFDGVTANTTFVLETKDQNVLLQELLPFIMLTDNFTKWSIGKSKGSTNPYILFSDLADYEFDLPPIEEQRKLATVLWKMFRLKEGYVELQHQSDQLVQSQFIEMFRECPKCDLSRLSVIDMGSSPDSKTYNEEGKGLPFYQGKTEFGEMIIGDAVMYCSAPVKIAQANDVLMSVRAPVGTVNLAKEECCIGRGLASIRAIDGKSEALFLFFALRIMEKEIEAMGVGSTFKAINKNALFSVQIPEASLELQSAFVLLAQQFDKSKFVLQEILKYDKISYFSMIKSA